MVLEGKISTIIYRNETNGYTVLLLKSEDEYITAVGETGEIEVGDHVEVDGDFTYHKSYGEQFQFGRITKMLPSDSDAIIKYIAASEIKGLGKKTAEKIVDTFGENTIDTIRYYPDKLLEIKGMNDEKAYALSEYINDEWEKWNLTSFLARYDIGINVSMKIYKALGLDSIKIIKEDPYSLMEFVSTLDFKTLDKLATGLHIPKEHENRIKAGIIYYLKLVMRNGHTCVLYDTLIRESSKLLMVEENILFNILEVLKNKDKIFIENRGSGKDYVYLSGMYYAEKRIAEKLTEMVKQSSRIKNLDKLIDKVSEKESIVLSDEQKLAIETAINSNVTIITGGPGTGKTTIIKCIIDILKEKKYSYVLAAPTGRAAKRITETTKEEAKTLHRLLEITKVDEGNIEEIINYPVEELEQDVVIIDEASMIDTILMNNLMKSLSTKTKLILVGDVYQLPAVGAGNVLKDIINSKVVDTVYLTEIYRQSKQSDIVVNAHKIKTGESIEFKKKDTDLFFIETGDIDSTVIELESLVRTRIKNFVGENFKEDIQVLTPIKKTDLGTYELNKRVQKIKINPTKDMVCKKHGDRTFYIGDKVMQITNNYDIKWDQNGTEGTGIFNGDTGKITSINLENEYLIVEYDESRKVKYDFDALDQIEHAYAITIHKSQGSEFDIVIIPLYICYEKLFNRNLIYTAMTRAKRLLVFVGKKQVLNYMIQNSNESMRETGLEFKLKYG